MCILCNGGRPKPLLVAAQFSQRRGRDRRRCGERSVCSPRVPQRHTMRTIRRATAAGRAGAISFAAAPIMSMDPQVGDFVRGDVLVEGKRILAIGPNLSSGNVDVIDARGRIVMPGFIDTHHHQAWTAIRSSIPDSILIDDGTGTPSAQQNYFANVLAGPTGTTGFARHYRPQDVYISELVGGLSQLDNGVTTVHDISQIHHSPQHSDAAVRGLIDAGRRGVLGYFESAGTVAGNQYPSDATRIKQQWFSSSRPARLNDHGRRGLSRAADLHPIMGDRPPAGTSDRGTHPVAVRHTPDPGRSCQPAGNDPLSIRSDNLFIHMTGMSDPAWNKVKQVGAQVSIAFPIEMNMRHGIPPILKMQSLGMEPSLSSDVETNMTACFFTQMRSAMTMQRMVVNQMILEQGDFTTPNPWPAPAPAHPHSSTFATCCATPPSTARNTCGWTERPARSSPARRPTSSFSMPPISTSSRSTMCRERSCR